MRSKRPQRTPLVSLEADAGRAFPQKLDRRAPLLRSPSRFLAWGPSFRCLFPLNDAIPEWLNNTIDEASSQRMTPV